MLVVDPNGYVQLDPALVAAALGLSPAESWVAVMLAEGSSGTRCKAPLSRIVHVSPGRLERSGVRRVLMAV